MLLTFFTTSIIIFFFIKKQIKNDKLNKENGLSSAFTDLNNETYEEIESDLIEDMKVYPYKKNYISIIEDYLKAKKELMNYKSIENIAYHNTVFFVLLGVVIGIFYLLVKFYKLSFFNSMFFLFFLTLCTFGIILSLVDLYKFLHFVFNYDYQKEQLSNFKVIKNEMILFSVLNKENQKPILLKMNDIKNFINSNEEYSKIVESSYDKSILFYGELVYQSRQIDSIDAKSIYEAFSGAIDEIFEFVIKIVQKKEAIKNELGAENSVVINKKITEMINEFNGNQSSLIKKITADIL